MKEIINREYEFYEDLPRMYGDYKKLFDVLSKKTVLISNTEAEIGAGGTYVQKSSFLMPEQNKPVVIYLDCVGGSFRYLTVEIHDRFKDNSKQKKKINSLCDLIRKTINEPAEHSSGKTGAGMGKY